MMAVGELRDGWGIKETGQKRALTIRSEQTQQPEKSKG